MRTFFSLMLLSLMLFIGLNISTMNELFAIKLDKKYCKTSNVLQGAPNKKDLKILSDCKMAIGKVSDVKKMPDGDYKFFLKVQNKFKYLLNKENKKSTENKLVIEIIRKHQHLKTVDLPHNGDIVKVWGAWVKDKPKGWYEIHPAWKVVIID